MSEVVDKHRKALGKDSPLCFPAEVLPQSAPQLPRLEPQLTGTRRRCPSTRSRQTPCSRA